MGERDAALVRPAAMRNWSASANRGDRRAQAGVLSQAHATVHGLLKLKRYNKLFPCLDRLEDNIRKGDKRFMDYEEFAKRNPLMAGLAMMGSAVAGGRKALEGDIAVPLPDAPRPTSISGVMPRPSSRRKKSHDSIPTDLQSARQMQVWTTGMLRARLRARR